MAKSGRKSSESLASEPVTRVAAALLNSRLEPLPAALKKIVERADVSAEIVHKLRVGCRRLAAALEFFSPLLPERSVPWWQKRLRKLRRAARKVRALDVLIGRFTDEPASKRELDRLRSERGELVEAMQQRLKVLSGPARLDKHSAALLAELRWEGGEEPTFAAWCDEPLQSAVQGLFAAEPRRPDDLPALHRLRVASKHLRYGLELVGECEPPRVKPLLKPAEELQSLLGAIQDQFDACHYRRRRLKAAATVGELTAGVELLEQETAKLQQTVQQFWRFWRRAKPRFQPPHRQRKPRSR